MNLCTCTISNKTRIQLISPTVTATQFLHVALRALQTTRVVIVPSVAMCAAAHGPVEEEETVIQNQIVLLPLEVETHLDLVHDSI